MNLRPDLDTPYDLRPDHVEQYHERGYVHLPGVFAPEELAPFETLLSREVDACNPFAGRPLAERTTYERAFVQITNLWQTCPDVQPLVFSKRLAAIAGHLMGARAVRLYHDQALYKEPGGGFTPWHADQYYWPLDGPQTCTAWIPLQDTPVEMGALAFSAGSHRHDLGRDLPISDESEQQIAEALAGADLPTHIRSFRLGDVSFHSGWTFHRAGANHTDQPRRVMTVIYFADGLRLAPPTEAQQADQEAFLPGLKPGDLAATPMNPILWQAEP